jgi:Tfp pilus assembly protein PilF
MAQRDAQRGVATLILAIFLGLTPVFLTGCVTNSEDRARLFNEDGIRMYAQGDYVAALDSFDMALTLRPEDATLLFNVAQCYDRLGNAGLAEKFYGMCLMRLPAHADARLALVELLYRTGEQAQADRLVEDWLRQDSTSSEAFVLEAWRLRQARNYPMAQARLQQALDVDPHNRRALAENAHLYELMGMPQRAYVLYERILQREPNQTQIAQRLDQLKAQGITRPLPE